MHFQNEYLHLKDYCNHQIIPNIKPLNTGHSVTTIFLCCSGVSTEGSVISRKFVVCCQKNVHYLSCTLFRGVR